MSFSMIMGISQGFLLCRKRSTVVGRELVGNIGGVRELVLWFGSPVDRIVAVEDSGAGGVIYLCNNGGERNSLVYILYHNGGLADCCGA